MQVSSYLFQSPYSSQVQIGRADPSVSNQESISKNNDAFTKNTNQLHKDAQFFNSTQVKDVSPSVSNTKLLDIYA